MRRKVVYGRIFRAALFLSSTARFTLQPGRHRGSGSPRQSKPRLRTAPESTETPPPDDGNIALVHPDPIEFVAAEIHRPLREVGLGIERIFRTCPRSQPGLFRYGFKILPLLLSPPLPPFKESLKESLKESFKESFKGVLACFAERAAPDSFPPIAPPSRFFRITSSYLGSYPHSTRSFLRNR